LIFWGTKIPDGTWAPNNACKFLVYSMQLLGLAEEKQDNLCFFKRARKIVFLNAQGKFLPKINTKHSLSREQNIPF
jgi:hypothetical protein